MNVSSKIHILKPYPQCDDIWNGVFERRLGHECGALISQISALIQETLEISFTSSTMYGHRKKTVVYESGSGPSLGTESAGVLILDFPILPEL